MTREEQDKLAKSLDVYIKEKHTQEECTGFIDGYENAIKDFKEYAQQKKKEWCRKQRDICANIALAHYEDCKQEDLLFNENHILNAPEPD